MSRPIEFVSSVSRPGRSPSGPRKSPGVAGAQSAEEATRSVHKRIVCEVLRQDIKLIAFMLFAILIMLGIVAGATPGRKVRKIHHFYALDFPRPTGPCARYPRPESTQSKTCMTGASPAAKRPPAYRDTNDTKSPPDDIHPIRKGVMVTPPQTRRAEQRGELECARLACTSLPPS